MQGHDDAFIVDRIRWRARRHGVPCDRTRFWEEAPTGLAGLVASRVRRPVLFSTRDECSTTVVGTDRALAQVDGVTSVVPIDEISWILKTDLHLGHAEPKREWDTLDLSLRDGDALTIVTEPGKGHFAVWNVILMLIRMQRR